MPQPTVSDIYRELISVLTAPLGQREATAAARIILEDMRGVTPTDLVVNGHRTLENDTIARIREIAYKIRNGMPVQYAVGQARFYGMDFVVTPDVLIPRPETEGLVDMIVGDFGSGNDLKVLDCGTGSGCIAIALARNLRFADIRAIDISEAALKVAEDNARRLKTRIAFAREDILTLDSGVKYKYDIIVSNPPYITHNESADMDPRVKDYEPSGALFVPDDDPLKFYRPIALFASNALKNDGQLYFEINPRFVDGLKEMLAATGFNNVDAERDYLGRYRFIRASR